MMGLSYEQEPVYEKLAKHYGNQLEFRYVMAGLVRDVSDFMLPSELSLPDAEGIRKYNKRLAGIYKDEETIGGLPINMDGFHLFDENHRSSYPLCIAYKAVQLCAPQRADDFLFKLRRATIVETRQTTLTNELESVSKESGIDVSAFIKCFNDGSAETAFNEDLALTHSYGIHSLPACLIEYGNSSTLVNGMLGYQNFCMVIEQLIQYNRKSN